MDWLVDCVGWLYCIPTSFLTLLPRHHPLLLFLPFAVHFLLCLSVCLSLWMASLYFNNHSKFLFLLISHFALIRLQVKLLRCAVGLLLFVCQLGNNFLYRQFDCGSKRKTTFFLKPQQQLKTVSQGHPHFENVNRLLYATAGDNLLRSSYLRYIFINL